MKGPEREELVFRAIASPHRRRILDLLAQGPKTTGAIAEALEGLSRFAAMQHLSVLEEAELIVARREGRSKVHHLNAVPLVETFRRWVGALAHHQSAGLLGLKGFIEGTEGTS